MKIEPVTLGGNFVRLEPLSERHFDALIEVGLDESIWRWSIDAIETKEDLRRYLENALDEQRRGVSLPFATIDIEKETIVGSTRFGNINPANRRVEIGWTWINPAWQRTHVNTEAKLLMLTHAFETWECIRVELKTDILNEKSRNAIVRIGAKQEGILRNYQITGSGRFRDTVFFSIIKDEWPEARSALQSKLRSR